jgi:uncharacterized membrane protein
MPRNSAQTVVPAPADALYAWLLDVDRWPEFMDGLEAVEPLSYRRYRWSVAHGARRQSVDVVLGADPRRRRISWCRTSRSSPDGVFLLEPVADGRTRVDLTIDVRPADLVESVLTAPAGAAERDLQALAALVRAGRLAEAG